MFKMAQWLNGNFKSHGGSGTHEELIMKGGVYRQLVNHQVRNGDEWLVDNLVKWLWV